MCNLKHFNFITNDHEKHAQLRFPHLQKIMIAGQTPCYLSVNKEAQRTRYVQKITVADVVFFYTLDGGAP